MSHDWKLGSDGINYCTQCRCTAGSRTAREECSESWDARKRRENDAAAARDADRAAVRSGDMSRAEYREAWGLQRLPEDYDPLDVP